MFSLKIGWTHLNYRPDLRPKAKTVDSRKRTSLSHNRGLTDRQELK
jgi:hypothetical protein